MHKKHFLQKHLLLGSLLTLSALGVGVTAMTPGASELQQRFEGEATRVLATSVKSQSAHLRYLPQPHLILKDVQFGTDIKIDGIHIQLGFLSLLKQNIGDNPLNMQLHAKSHSAHLIVEKPSAWQKGLASPINITLKGEYINTQLNGTVQGVSAKLEAKELWVQGYQLKDALFTLSPQAAVLHGAQGYKGVFSGQMTPDGKMQLQAKSVEMLTFLPLLYISGQGLLEASGQFIKGQTLPLSAKVSVTMGTGNFHQGNLEDTIRDVVRRPLARSSTPLKVGSTPFTALHAALKWQGKWVSDGDITLTTANSHTLLQGTGAWNGRNLSLKGFATLKKEALELPFMVQGSVQEPLLRFDVQQLIQRSKATAPLRSPARDEDAAKAVLDVMTRTTPLMAAPEELIKNISKSD